MIVAYASSELILGGLAILFCLLVFTIGFAVAAIANLALIAVRELTYRRRRRRRAVTLYGSERRR